MMSRPRRYFLDDPVDALVAGMANGLPRFRPRPAVAHGHEHIHHEAFEERRGRPCPDLIEQIAGDTVSQRLVGGL